MSGGTVGTGRTGKHQDGTAQPGLDNLVVVTVELERFAPRRRQHHPQITAQIGDQSNEVVAYCPFFIRRGLMEPGQPKVNQSFAGLAKQTQEVLEQKWLYAGYPVREGDADAENRDFDMITSGTRRVPNVSKKAIHFGQFCRVRCPDPYNESYATTLRACADKNAKLEQIFPGYIEPITEETAQGNASRIVRTAQRELAKPDYRAQKKNTRKTAEQLGDALIADKNWTILHSYIVNRITERIEPGPKFLDKTINYANIKRKIDAKDPIVVKAMEEAVELGKQLGLTHEERMTTFARESVAHLLAGNGPMFDQERETLHDLLSLAPEIERSRLLKAASFAGMALESKLAIYDLELRSQHNVMALESSNGTAQNSMVKILI